MENLPFYFEDVAELTANNNYIVENKESPCNIYEYVDRSGDTVRFHFSKYLNGGLEKCKKDTIFAYEKLNEILQKLTPSELRSLKNGIENKKIQFFQNEYLYCKENSIGEGRLYNLQRLNLYKSIANHITYLAWKKSLKPLEDSPIIEQKDQVEFNVQQKIDELVEIEHEKLKRQTKRHKEIEKYKELNEKDMSK